MSELFDSTMNPKYSKEELVRHARALFHLPPEVLAGALLGSPAQRWTVSEAEQLILTFMNRKVK